ncbi:MAG TPA: (Fe-S)-binding protein [Methanothrix sp.]|nr:(Fe-S)-binding protein [Methanothrix sp.]
MEAIKDRMHKNAELVAKEANQCVQCGTCRAFCPVIEESGWESANARGRIMILKGLASGLSPDAQVLESLNSCTTCGICTENCPAGINPPQLIEGGRRDLVMQGVVTPQQDSLSKKIFLHGNTFGTDQDRLSWLSDRSLLAERADYVYFAGCMNSYRYTETAARTFEILRRLGATMLPEEVCCGSPLMRTGFDASRFVKKNCSQIALTGASTVITGCAGCYTTLKNNYPHDFEVKSVAEFLAEHLSELNIVPLDLTVTYHDPCHLGRHNGIYEPPRQIIRAICRLKEMNASKKAARCCGGGGGVRSAYRDLSLRMARKRLQDVPDGVDYIVTACPLCIRNLSDAGAAGKVIDLVDLVKMAMH